MMTATRKRREIMALRSDRDGMEGLARNWAFVRSQYARGYDALLDDINTNERKVLVKYLPRLMRYADIKYRVSPMTGVLGIAFID